MRFMRAFMGGGPEPSGQIVVLATGTVQIPLGVKSICGVAVGRGYGGGGSLSYRNDVAVTPLETLNVEITNSYTRLLRSGVELIRANAGTALLGGVAYVLGDQVSFSGGDCPTAFSINLASGGGAAGYLADGPNGRNSNGVGSNGSGGSGGAGGRGSNGVGTSTPVGGGGGGVGLLGVQGSVQNGAGGTGSTGLGGIGGGGTGGSGGGAGGNSQNNAGAGGLYGGGSGFRGSSGSGSRGAPGAGGLRLIYGKDRDYPYNASDVA